MPIHRPTARRLVATVAASLLAAALVPAATATAAEPRTKRVVVAALEQGTKPRVDVVVGRTLIHQQRAVRLRLPAGVAGASAMGTYRGTPIVAAGVSGGTRFYAVAPNGSMTPRGVAYETYNYEPQLVRATGHLLVPYSDRGTGNLTVTVLEAATGRELAVVGDAEGDGDPAGLPAADRAVIRRWSGHPTVGVAAFSPDRSLKLSVKDPGYGPPVTLTVRRTEGGAALARFEFPYYDPDTETGSVVPGEAVFENNRSFLVLGISDPGTLQGGGERYVVVRCTVGGTCKRAAGPAKSISIAGAGALEYTRRY